MTELLVLRHAKSAWPEGVGDRDRPLARRGERAAGVMGRFLATAALLPDRVVCSPALRAAETTRLVLRAAGAVVPVVYDERIYEDATLEVALEVLAGDPGAGRVLIVGHEPGLLETVYRLTGAVLALPTACLVWLDLPQGSGELAAIRLVLPPKLAERAGG